MQRVVALFGQQLIRRDHDDGVVVLDADLDIAETVIFEQRRLPERRFDECLRGGLAVLLQNSLIQGAGVDPDADRDACRARGLGHLSDPAVKLFDVPRIHPHRGATRINGGEDVFRLEVDVGDYRDLALARDLSECVGILLSRAGHPDDVATGRGQFGDLLQRRVDVMGLGGAHRLHRDREVTADADITHHQLTGLTPRRQGWRGWCRYTEADRAGAHLNLLLEQPDWINEVSGHGQRHIADHHGEDHIGGGH